VAAGNVGIGFVGFHNLRRLLRLPLSSGGSLLLPLLPVLRNRVKLYAKDIWILLFSTKWFSRREVKGHLDTNFFPSEIYEAA
jgi:hypothetical protein